MTGWYQNAYDHEDSAESAFGQSNYPEPGIPVYPRIWIRKDGPYFHMNEKVWRVQFEGVDRPETFPPEAGRDAFALYCLLKAET